MRETACNETMLYREGLSNRGESLVEDFKIDNELRHEKTNTKTNWERKNWEGFIRN